MSEHRTNVELARDLWLALRTATNDDCSVAGTEQRARHIQRMNAIEAAAERLEELPDSET